MDYVLDAEVLTGQKWIDGKPIYKKTMRFSTIQNNSVLANISNVGTLVDLDGTLSANTGTMFTSIPFTQFPNYGISLVMNQSGNLSAYVNNMQIDWMIVSVYYTKTTD